MSPAIALPLSIRNCRSWTSPSETWPAVVHSSSASSSILVRAHPAAPSSPLISQAAPPSPPRTSPAGPLPPCSPSHPAASPSSSSAIPALPPSPAPTQHTYLSISRFPGLVIHLVPSLVCTSQLHRNRLRSTCLGGWIVNGRCFHLQLWSAIATTGNCTSRSLIYCNVPLALEFEPNSSPGAILFLPSHALEPSTSTTTLPIALSRWSGRWRRIIVCGRGQYGCRWGGVRCETCVGWG